MEDPHSRADIYDRSALDPLGADCLDQVGCRSGWTVATPVVEVMRGLLLIEEAFVVLVAAQPARFISWHLPIMPEIARLKYCPGTALDRTWAVR